MPPDHPHEVHALERRFPSLAPLSTPRILLGGLLATLAAVVFALVTRAILLSTVDVHGEFEPLAQVGSSVALSAAGAALATVVLVALARWTRRPLRWFAMLGAAFLLVTMAGPWWIWSARPYPGSSGLTAAHLAMMHVVVGAAIMGILGAFAADK